ncbi:hypothetical protein CYG49_02835 [Candidatus Saccharibacteria bacterium]|nr:MAG: hypothetical protein CYG49_02835 [Candidatus Saccharibacteria bacterium]
MSTTDHTPIAKSGLTIVIPAYNAESWLAPTSQRLKEAINETSLKKVEIIIVDDGSKDGTFKVAKSLSKDKDLKISALHHENKGRFITRKRGVEAAIYENILFIDTRVWIDKDSLKFVLQQQLEHPDRIIWNGHVNVAKQGNIIARFGDSITFIGWRRYFSNPKLTGYGLKDFDYYPKGTTMFIAPKSIIVEAIEWFERTTIDIEHSSDDTLLIRHMAESNTIWLSPEFSCTYFARTNIKAFIRHTFYRGQYFVDGFLRPGTRFYIPLIVFLLGSIVALVLTISMPWLLLWWIVAGAIGWFGLLFGALALGVQAKDAFSLFILSPIFTVMYGAGIWTAVLRKLKQRK